VGTQIIYIYIFSQFQVKVLVEDLAATPCIADLEGDTPLDHARLFFSSSFTLMGEHDNGGGGDNDDCGGGGGGGGGGGNDEDNEEDENPVAAYLKKATAAFTARVGEAKAEEEEGKEEEEKGEEAVLKIQGGLIVRNEEAEVGEGRDNDDDFRLVGPNG
jgi:hypothetical protein